MAPSVFTQQINIIYKTTTNKWRIEKNPWAMDRELMSAKESLISHSQSSSNCFCLTWFCLYWWEKRLCHEEMDIGLKKPSLLWWVEPVSWLWWRGQLALGSVWLLPEADQGRPLALSESPFLHLTWGIMSPTLLEGFSEVMQLKVFCNL